MLHEEAEHFDCEDCELADMQASLDLANSDAFEAFRKLASRFVVDAGIGPCVFQALAQDRDRDDLLDLVERLRVIYDILSPPPAPKGD